MTMNRKVFTLIMFAVLVFLLGARAATAQWISLPKASELGNSISSFFPIIFKNYSATSANPHGVLYVFSSTSTTDGDAGGRPGMNTICSNEDSLAHFCTVSEVENAFKSNGVYFATPIHKSWVDTPLAMSSWSDDYENCSAWTSASSAFGKAINHMASHVVDEQCNQNIRVACCKWIQ
jgi:hypothetical protein